MLPLLIIGSVLCGWAMLSVLGGERQRRLDEIEIEISAQKRAAEIAAANASPPKLDPNRKSG
jgi:hypothetical protein